MSLVKYKLIAKSSKVELNGHTQGFSSNYINAHGKADLTALEIERLVEYLTIYRAITSREHIPLEVTDGSRNGTDLEAEV
jgi:hypothetical protein